MEVNLNSDFLKIAAKIFNVDGKPEFLSKHLALYLTAINEKCRRVGGRLYSRQAIAIAVETWIMVNPNLVAYRI